MLLHHLRILSNVTDNFGESGPLRGRPSRKPCDITAPQSKLQDYCGHGFSPQIYNFLLAKLYYLNKDDQTLMIDSLQVCSMHNQSVDTGYSTSIVRKSDDHHSLIVALTATYIDCTWYKHNNCKRR